MNIRPITPDDLELICRHREEMFRDSGRPEEALAPMTENFRRWLEPRLNDGSYFGMIVLDGDDKPIAGVGLMLIDWPPHPSHPMEDKRGYVLNVYVEPEYRRRHIANMMMELAEEEFRRRGVTYAILHSTTKGKPLYANMGWGGTTEMAKAL